MGVGDEFICVRQRMTFNKTPAHAISIYARMPTLLLFFPRTVMISAANNDQNGGQTSEDGALNCAHAL
jgi:hypothetical protein